MSSRWTPVAVVGAWLILTRAGLAADPVQGEVLPSPRTLPPAQTAPLVVLPVPLYEPPNSYDRWQSYGVDRLGRFRPRVIYTPEGFYYYRNGAPFPWPTVNAMAVMPYAVD